MDYKRLDFPIDYYDDEIRDGFYVPSIMKHNWAAQMEVLNVVDQICSKNNIKYFMFSGTLIGAVRHGGFIPWDDDIDICMLRKDYKRFLKAFDREKPERYYIRNCHTDPTYRDVFSRLMNESMIGTNEEFWGNGHGFLVSAGIDVFPLDYIPTDVEKRDEISTQIMHLCYIIKKYDELGLYDELDGKIRIVEDTFRVKITRDDTIPQQIYKLMEEILESISRAESKCVQISLNWAQNENLSGIPIECFKESVELSFETTSFKAPYMHNLLLSNMFGNYMSAVRVCNIHDFPWYQKLYDELLEHTTVKLYEYDSSLLPEIDRHTKWVQELLSEAKENMDVFSKANEMAERLIEGGDSQSAQLLLDKCQDLAVNVANIERKLKGTGRDRVVFFAWKAEYWKCYEPYYKAEVEAGSEVFVVTVPYVRLTEVRGQTEEFLETEGFPDYVKITDFNDINYGDIRINRMYTQNPYDTQNGAVIVRPFFQTTSLTKYTDELIYIPWFELDEYGQDDKRAMYMMQYFTRLPGIIAVDKIILAKNQEWLRKFYVEDLVKWAGEETREIWEDKICICDIKLTEEITSSETGNNVGGFDSCEDVNNTDTVVDQDFDRTDGRKSFLYYLGTSQMLEEPQLMIEKIKKNLEVFDGSPDKFKINLLIEHGLIESLNSCKKEFVKPFMAVLDSYKSKDWCDVTIADEVIRTASDIADKVVRENNAFYGDAGVIAHMFSCANKPVMIQNVKINN